MIRLAGRRLDEPRHLPDDRSLGKAIHGLTDDPQRLPELLEPAQVAVVRVAREADRHVELELAVRRVRLVLAAVLRHAGAAQRRTGQTDRDRLEARDHADALRPLEPDAVVRQQLLVLADLLLHESAELADLLVPAGRDVERKSADAHRVVGQPRAAVLLEEVEDQLALAERVEEHGHRADVHRVRPEPEAMAGDPLQLGENRPDVMGAARHLELHQLLDRLAVAEVVGRRRDVVHPVGEQDDLRPVAALAQLLDPAVQVADHHVGADDPLAVQAQHDPQHAVRARVLRTHVDHQLVGVEHGLGCGDLFHLSAGLH